MKQPCCYVSTWLVLYRKFRFQMPKLLATAYVTKLKTRINLLMHVQTLRRTGIAMSYVYSIAISIPASGRHLRWLPEASAFEASGDRHRPISSISTCIIHRFVCWFTVCNCMMAFKTALIIVAVGIAVAYFAGDHIKDMKLVKKYFPKDLAGQISSYFGGTSEAKKSDKKKGKVEKLFTKEELWNHYRGGKGSKGLYLAIMGRVYDVSKGERHYAGDGGYSFFAGRDGTKAYATGDFTDAGLTDDLTGVPTEGFGEYENWVKFFDGDYTYVGKVIGNFYDENGNPTDALKEAQRQMEEARKLKKLEEEENKKFPRCNSEWTQKTGSRVWCTRKSGGIDREWVGVPRKLHPVGAKNSYCVCIRNSGPPTLDHTTKDDNRGDLDYPYLKEYEGCASDSFECKVK